jgi:hypothetical protein
VSAVSADGGAARTAGSCGAGSIGDGGIGSSSTPAQLDSRSRTLAAPRHAAVDRPRRATPRVFFRNTKNHPIRPIGPASEPQYS